MLQIQLLLAQANLLRIQLLSEGYIAENQRWVTAGSEPCYPEASFQYLAQEVESQMEALRELQKQHDSLPALVRGALSECCGTTLEKEKAVAELIARVRAVNGQEGN